MNDVVVHSSAAVRDIPVADKRLKRRVGCYTVLSCYFTHTLRSASSLEAELAVDAVMSRDVLKVLLEISNRRKGSLFDSTATRKIGTLKSVSRSDRTVRSEWSVRNGSQPWVSDCASMRYSKASSVQYAQGQMYDQLQQVSSIELVEAK